MNKSCLKFMPLYSYQYKYCNANSFEALTSKIRSFQYHCITKKMHHTATGSLIFLMRYCTVYV
jgi:hypothetical protein